MKLCACCGCVARVKFGRVDIVLNGKQIGSVFCCNASDTSLIVNEISDNLCPVCDGWEAHTGFICSGNDPGIDYKYVLGDISKYKLNETKDGTILNVGEYSFFYSDCTVAELSYFTFDALRFPAVEDNSVFLSDNDIDLLKVAINVFLTEEL